MPSDDGSSLVKDGSLEEMDVDEVDAAIAVVRTYKDREPEVPLFVWYGKLHVPDPLDITGYHMNPRHPTGGIVNSP